MKVVDYIVRGTVSLVNSARKLQSLQTKLTAGEVKDGVEHFETYGFTANPHPGAEVVLAFVGGDRSHGIAISTPDRRYRLQNLESGEVAIYDDLGNKVWLKRDCIFVEAVQHLEVVAPTCNITATTTHDGNVTINGNLQVNGNIDATKNITDGVSSMQGMRDTYNSHDHTENDSGGPTDKPNQSM